MNVKYSDVRTIVNAVYATEAATAAGTRGTAFNPSDITLTADTLTISSYRDIGIFIDEADRAQQSYMDAMQAAVAQGKKIDERFETEMLGSSTSWTDFGQGDLDQTSVDSTVLITITASNIGKLIRSLKRKIHVNNGLDLALENGYFVIWRSADWELLEELVMASGFNQADLALKSGVSPAKAFHYMGVDHYLSTSHAANHLFAGVKKVGKDLGILNSTYGKVKFIENPPGSSGGMLSGLGIVARMDWGFSWPSAGPASQALVQLAIDVNVA